MAMTDYPYPTNFLNPMPGHPVEVACQVGFESYKPPGSTGQNDINNNTVTLINRLINATNVYFNWNNKTDFCVNWKDTGGAGNLADAAWAVLTCNQLAMPDSTGDGTMFIKQEFDKAAYTKGCQTNYGLTPDYGWPMREFGGANVARDFKHYSNIVFSNGELDPWIAGGVTEYINLKLPYYIIQGGAHHLDLRLPNDADAGTDVARVRDHESRDLRSWIDEYQAQFVQAPTVSEDL